MNIHHALLFCCLSAALSDGNTRLIDAQQVFTRTEGEAFRHNFTVSGAKGSRKYLCRDACGKGDVLIETRGSRADSGRYTIRHGGVLQVAIAELGRSDAGRYRLGVDDDSSLGSFWDFEIRVRELCEGVVFREPRGFSGAVGGNVTITCPLSTAERNRKFLCRDKCEKVVFETNTVAASAGRYAIEYGASRFFNVTIARLTQSDSGRYRCGVGRQTSENICQEFEIAVTDAGGPGVAVPLVVSLTAAALLAVSLLLLGKWKRGGATGLSCRRTSTTRDSEFGPYDNVAPAATLEDHNYETLDSNHYETLNQHNTAHDQMYSTL